MYASRTTKSAVQLYSWPVCDCPERSFPLPRDNRPASFFWTDRVIKAGDNNGLSKTPIRFTRETVLAGPSALGCVSHPCTYISNLQPQIELKSQRRVQAWLAGSTARLRREHMYKDSTHVVSVIVENLKPTRPSPNVRRRRDLPKAHSLESDRGRVRSPAKLARR